MLFFFRFQNESHKAESASPLHELQTETQKKLLAEYHM